MTKLELIQNVASKVASENVNKKQTIAVVNAVFEAVKEGILKDGHIAYPDFGTFTVKTRKAREGRNPHTSEPIHIPETNTVSYRPAPKLKAALNVKKADAKDAKKEVKAEKKAPAKKAAPKKAK